jgi:hypothetical protein
LSYSTRWDENRTKKSSTRGRNEAKAQRASFAFVFENEEEGGRVEGVHFLMH